MAQSSRVANIKAWVQTLDQQQQKRIISKGIDTTHKIKGNKLQRLFQD
jgi:hypothetical protein